MVEGSVAEPPGTSSSPSATARRSRKVPTSEQRAALGKAARAKVPRSSLAAVEAEAGRPDPVELLESQATTRLPELVPLRYARMVASPFAFYRGAALIMASDLSRSPNSGLRAQLCDRSGARVALEETDGDERRDQARQHDRKQEQGWKPEAKRPEHGSSLLRYAAGASRAGLTL